MVPFSASLPSRKSSLTSGGIWEGAVSREIMLLPGGTPATGQILSLECGEFGLARLQVILSITAAAEASSRVGFTEWAARHSRRGIP
jgi:hypothetical protein